MARYELPDGKTGKYFEITLAGNRVVTRAGIVGAFSTMADGKTVHRTDRGKDGGRTYKDAGAAQRAFDKAVADKRAEGYRRVDRPDDAEESGSLADSELRRAPSLEAAIAAGTPDDPTPYLVYADWLQQEGDPRGTFIVLQDAMRKQHDPKAFLDLKKQVEALRFAHERAWLGKIAFAAAHRMKLDWRFGFVESARIETTSNPTEPPLATVLAALLDSAAGCALRYVEFTPNGDRPSDEMLAALALLPVPSLRRIKGQSRCANEEATRDAYAPHEARIAAAGVAITFDWYR